MKKSFLHFLVCLLLYVTFCVPLILFYPESTKVHLDENQLVYRDFYEKDNIKVIGDLPEFSYIPKTINKGETVTVRFKTDKNTDFKIYAYYKNGLSKSKDFDPKKSDIDGNFVLDFVVPHNVSSDKIRIIIASNSTKIEIEINILP